MFCDVGVVLSNRNDLRSFSDGIIIMAGLAVGISVPEKGGNRRGEVILGGEIEVKNGRKILLVLNN